jgi:tetratricopeptide (TPR) repeat protein
MAEISAEFVGGLLAGLAFWRERLEPEPDARLDGEQHNLHRAIQIGLSVPDAHEAAADVAAAAFPYVLARAYYAEWLPLMERASIGYTERPTAGRFWVLTRLGQLRRLNHKLLQSIEAHEIALEVARAIGEPILVAEAQYHLGRALRDAHRDQQANEHLQCAVQMLEDVEGEYVQRLTGLAVNALGRVAHDLGQLAEARQYLERAVTIARAVGRAHPLSERLLDLGNLLRAAGMYEEALPVYGEALALLPDKEFPLERVQIQYAVGILHFARQEYDQAERAFRGLDWIYLRDTGNLAQQAYLVNSLGNSVLYQKRYEEAAEILREAIVLWRELGDDLELANSTGSLGEALAGMGAKEEASHVFTTALELLAQFPDSGTAAQLRKFFAGEQAKLAGQEASDQPPTPPTSL